MFIDALNTHRAMTAMRYATTMFVHTSVRECLISARPIFSADAGFDLTRLRLGAGGRLVGNTAQVLRSFDDKPTLTLKLSANPERAGGDDQQGLRRGCPRHGVVTR
jgi:hypothetical protein